LSQRWYILVVVFVVILSSSIILGQCLKTGSDHLFRILLNLSFTITQPFDSITYANEISSLSKIIRIENHTVRQTDRTIIKLCEKHIRSESISSSRVKMQRQWEC